MQSRKKAVKVDNYDIIISELETQIQISKEWWLQHSRLSQAEFSHLNAKSEDIRNN